MKIHLFPFSPRKGTPAADYPDQVSGTRRQERMRRLEELERELAERYYATLLGRNLEVMVETTSTREGWVSGTDRYYVPVELPGTTRDIGRMCYGRAIRTTRHFLEAERETFENVNSRLQAGVLHNRGIQDCCRRNGDSPSFM